MTKYKEGYTEGLKDGKAIRQSEIDKLVAEVGRLEKRVAELLGEEQPVNRDHLNEVHGIYDY